MKTTALKSKPMRAQDLDYVYTEEDTARERAAMDAELKRNPCRELSDRHARLQSEYWDSCDDDAPLSELPAESEELKAAEAACEECEMNYHAQQLRAKYPHAIVSISADYMHALWMESLANPDYATMNDAIYFEPMQARRFNLALALPGYADQDHIRLAIESRVIQETKGGHVTYRETLDHDAITLAVHVGGRIIARGTVTTPLILENKDAAALVLRGEGATQELGDTVLGVITDINPFDDWPMGLYARFALLGRCHQCNRPLTDHVSKVLQIGPTCAKRLGLAHNSAIAQKITQLREKDA